MKLLTTICIPALLLAATALAAPAMAQDNANPSSTSSAAAPTQPAQDANSAAVPAQTAANADSTSTPIAAPSGNVQTAPSGNTQTAMNTTGNAGDLSSIPDNQHKYSSAKKAAQNRSEDQTTQQLNKQEASLNGASTSGAQ
jgi:hypothetical protein